jgi:hypothetical protein
MRRLWDNNLHPVYRWVPCLNEIRREEQILFRRSWRAMQLGQIGSCTVFH